MVDFSHANSQKQHQRQIAVAQDVGHQIAGGDARIVGAMIESHLVAGRQDIGPREKMVYGQSVTDACIGWNDTATPCAASPPRGQRRRKLAKSA